MILDDLAAFLQAGGHGIVSQSLFKGGFPLDTPTMAAPGVAMALVAVPGLPPFHVHNQAAAAWEQPVVQILTRGVPYGHEDTALRAQAAFVALDSVSNQTLGVTWYLWILALQSPFFLKMDDAARPIWAFSVRCAKAL